KVGSIVSYSDIDYVQVAHHASEKCYFFFQAEDGIRDFHVTGVQTCALPILTCRPKQQMPISRRPLLLKVNPERLKKLHYRPICPHWEVSSRTKTYGKTFSDSSQTSSKGPNKIGSFIK